MLPTWSRN